MILDSIIALIGSIISLFTGAVATIVNGIAALIELVVGLFVPDFELSRIGREEKETSRTAQVTGGSMLFLLVVALVVIFGPILAKREVTFVASDGHSLPFAALMVHTSDGDHHERTDSEGKVEIPRFGVEAITVMDPRYVERRWEKSEIDRELVVERTLLGSGLDTLAGKLLKPTD